MKKFLIFGFLFFPFLAKAAGLVPCGGEGEPLCNLCYIFVLVDRVLDFLSLRLVPLVSVLIIVVSGFIFGFSLGSEKLIGKARGAFKGVVIGLGLFYGAWLLVNLSLQAVGLTEWKGVSEGGWSVECNVPDRYFEPEVVLTTDVEPEAPSEPEGSGDNTGQKEAKSSEMSMPLFLQGDSRWKNKMYGHSGTIGEAGCGPTSFAMVATALGAIPSSFDFNNDSVLDPYEAAQFSVSIGGRAEYYDKEEKTWIGDGTNRQFFLDAGGKVGLDVSTYYEKDFKKVLEELKDGNPIIVHCNRGHFTGMGHYIVLNGIDSEGNIIFYDPNFTTSPIIWKSRWDNREINHTSETLNDFIHMKVDPLIIKNEVDQYFVFKP